MDVFDRIEAMRGYVDRRGAGAGPVGLVPTMGALHADHGSLLDTGPEVISCSTRMNAGTAQKAALNMLSSLTMIRLNRTHDGLMVDHRVQNAKLRERAIGILQNITGASKDSAVEALAACNDRIKPAALVLAGRSPAEAEQILSQVGGSLRAALESSKPNLQRKQGS